MELEVRYCTLSTAENPRISVKIGPDLEHVLTIHTYAINSRKDRKILLVNT